MTDEQVKTYLKQVRKLKRSSVVKLDKIRQLQEQAVSVTATIKSDVAQSKGLNNKSFADAIVAILDLRDSMLSDIQKENELAQKIELELHEMAKEEEELATLLRAYYVDFWNWRKVCASLHYTWRTVHRMHRKALKVFKNYITLDI